MDYSGDVLKRCEKNNMVLNRKKYYFMLKKGIVVGYKISGKGIEVDRAKIKVFEKFPLPIL